MFKKYEASPKSSDQLIKLLFLHPQNDSFTSITQTVVGDLALEAAAALLIIAHGRVQTIFREGRITRFNIF